ncbi:Ribosomal RNA processing protein 1-like protein B [Microtus ochrogaster]|uniref:Ribosomal RNA processing protein 1-like protein B n=1 Tax=Microtus ochrogaster TaxID=79684 RepID=A0A8J6GW58_MICOH|nr:Ribosomal RNA processing protein 1-like protein B [Microtus ochrogaster]
MAPAMQSAQLQFAQRLASSEKGVRDRAVRKLRQYLSARTQSDTGGFSQDELLKIWRGLFYCMWVQDEPLLQEELANIISQLIHVVHGSEAQHLFLQTFWQTMNREWEETTDELQLDKYCMLIHLVLRQSFEVLKRKAWEESQIKLFLGVLMKEILSPESQSSNGVRNHLIDAYLDELSIVGGKELLADQNLKLIDPFCRIAAKTKDHALVQTIARDVFEVIIDQSAFVPEETVEEQRTKVVDSGLSARETPADKLACTKAVRGKKAAAHSSQWSNRAQAQAWDAAMADCVGAGLVGQTLGPVAGLSVARGLVNSASLPPGDLQLKSYSQFNSFRWNCLAAVNTKPPYQNLRQKVNNFVSTHLGKQEWNPAVNKKSFAKWLRQSVVQSGMLEAGFDLKAVADRLLEIANSKSTPPFNRKRLFRLIRKFQNPSEGNSVQLSFAQDVSADENGQALSQRKHKKKRKKLLERAALDKEKGNTVSLDGEEDNGGNIPKKKKKKKKKSHFQAETQDLDAVIMPPADSTDLEPNNAKRQTPQARVTGPAAEPTASIKENSSKPTHFFPTHKKRKWPRKKSLRAHREFWKSTPLSQEDVAENDPSSDQPQSSAAQVSSSEGVQRKRKRKLGAVPVNSGSLTVQKAGTPTSPSEEKDSQTTLPQCKRPQKTTVSCSLDLHDLSSQKSAILKKKKKMKLMSKLVEHNEVNESSAGQIPALESIRTLKKPLKTEDDFVKFDTHFLPKPLFFRKAKSSSAIRPQSPAVQLNKTPSSSKKVTFGLNRNMTAEFKKTDKSILVSPTGLSRVAFNPEQRPLHGVLKTPTSSPASTPTSTMKLPATTPKRRPRAADFF